MDWQTWLANWGPAAPFALFICKAFYDLVYTKLPDSLKGIKRLIVRIEKRSARRHDEHVRLQMRLAQDLEELRKELRSERDKSRRRRKKAPE